MIMFHTLIYDAFSYRKATSASNRPLLSLVHHLVPCLSRSTIDSLYIAFQASGLTDLVSTCAMFDMTYFPTDPRALDTRVGQD
ncbi:Protein of unknown function [Pyronema omphalodes CBS 100304]|uniref:Uncharacterized protein n=1 Tax=Pyronema omphalodes (strain CBS 100304) TaxID=1076935 RepID=U4LDG0_PYROM|nr:Protein of unknown function [Pyronema omphalodes CBS 100304]